MELGQLGLPAHEGFSAEGVLVNGLRSLIRQLTDLGWIDSLQAVSTSVADSDLPFWVECTSCLDASPALVRIGQRINTAESPKFEDVLRTLLPKRRLPDGCDAYPSGQDRCGVESVV